MRNFTLKALAVLLFAFTCLNSNAYDVAVDGLYYDLVSESDATVAVTYATTKYNSYSGDITVPASITVNNKTYTVSTIGTSAFRKCTSLTSISLPSTIDSIASKAFYNCTSLTSFTMPDSVTTLPSALFYGCTKLSSVTLHDGITASSSQVFYNCTALTSITLPQYLTNIGTSMFYKCSSLESVTLSNNLTCLSNQLFSSCSSLKSVTIPASVDSVATQAFVYCYALAEVTSLNTTPPVAASASFPDTTYSGTLYVPIGCADTYKSATTWENFSNIVELDENVGIDAVIDNKDKIITSECYYTTNGVEIKNPIEGRRDIYIVVKKYEDGTMEVTKEVR